MFVGLRKRLRWQGVVLGLRFVEIRACRPEVCRSFDQGQQRVRWMVALGGDRGRLGGHRKF